MRGKTDLKGPLQPGETSPKELGDPGRQPNLTKQANWGVSHVQRTFKHLRVKSVNEVYKDTKETSYLEVDSC